MYFRLDMIQLKCLDGVVTDMQSEQQTLIIDTNSKLCACGTILFSDDEKLNVVQT